MNAKLGKQIKEQYNKTAPKRERDRVPADPAHMPSPDWPIRRTCN